MKIKDFWNDHPVVAFFGVILGVPSMLALGSSALSGIYSVIKGRQILKMNEQQLKINEQILRLNEQKMAFIEMNRPVSDCFHDQVRAE